MIFQSQGDRARHECDRRELLANTIMQFLCESFLFPIADLENLTLESFTAGDLVFQFGIGETQRFRPLLDDLFQHSFRPLHRRFIAFAISNVDLTMVNRGGAAPLPTRSRSRTLTFRSQSHFLNNDLQLVGIQAAITS
jgi:hypothetical protein